MGVMIFDDKCSECRMYYNHMLTDRGPCVFCQIRNNDKILKAIGRYDMFLGYRGIILCDHCDEAVQLSRLDGSRSMVHEAISLARAHYRKCRAEHRGRLSIADGDCGQLALTTEGGELSWPNQKDRH